MSMYFKVGDQYAWDVSKRIGRLFESQTRALETLVGQKSGMADFANDECEIDPDLYAAFVDRLITFHDSQNNVGKSLVRGYLAPALVLFERGGLTISSLATSDVDWTAAARAIELSMPQ